MITSGGILGSGADEEGGYGLPDVLAHGGPPEPLLKTETGPLESGMT